MSGEFRLSLNTSGLDGFMAELVAADQESIRPAAQAGAQVFYDQARARVKRTRKAHYFHGRSFRVNGTKYLFQPGTLQRAIYQVFSKDNSGPGRAAYHVSWNAKEAPYGSMVEFGTSRAPAHSFIRSTFASHEKLAGDAIEARYFAELTARGVVS
jgi:HK97 gp10 family phage protein